MENTTLIIEEKEKEDAKALTQSFVRADVRSRAFVNALGSEVCLKYLRENDISDEKTYNLHNIRKILEEFDISDIILSNIHIDVRVVYDENEIFIPKSHFIYNLIPDIYVVMKISKNYSNTEFLGFFEPKMLNKNNENDKYYFIEKEKLSSPVDLKNYIKNFQGTTSKEYSQEELEDAEFLIISMADHNVTEEDKRKLLEYLKNSAKLRDRFIEFENFEMMAYQASNVVGLDNTKKETETPSDLSTEDIVEEASAPEIEGLSDLKEEDIVEDPINEENSVLGGFVEGAAILGAEIAGTAMASAALAGAAESAQIAETAAGTAASAAAVGKEIVTDTANTVSNLTNIGDEIQKEPSPLDVMDEVDSYQDEHPAAATQDFSQDFTPIEDSLSDLGETNEIIFNNEENSVPYGDVEITDEMHSMVNNIDENYTDHENNKGLYDTFDEDLLDFSTQSDNFNKTNSSNEIEFTNKDDEDLIFEDFGSNESNNYNSGEIEFTNNDDYDDIVFENNDDYDDYSDNTPEYSSGSSSDKGAASGPPGIQTVIHTPISEATDLVSMESLQTGNIAPVEMPKSDFDSMETMEMEEFTNLANNYVPQQIVDESVTTDFSSVDEASKQLSIEHDQLSSFNENVAEMIDIPTASQKEEILQEIDENELPSIDEKQPEDNSSIKTQDHLTSDDFVQEIPEEIKPEDNSIMKTQDDLTSDDFVQERPEELQPEDNSLMKTQDDLTSDDFIQEMPEELQPEDNSLMKTQDDLTSDDFIQEMPEELQPEDNSLMKTQDDLTSDDFVQEMPEELQPEDNSLMKTQDDLTSDDFVQEMPEEMLQEQTLIEEPSEAITLNSIDEQEIAEEELSIVQEPELDVQITEEPDMELAQEQAIDIETEPEIETKEPQAVEDVSQDVTDNTVTDNTVTDTDTQEVIEIKEDYTTSEINSVDDLSILDELENLAEENTDAVQEIPEENAEPVIENIESKPVNEITEKPETFVEEDAATVESSYIEPVQDVPNPTMVTPLMPIIDDEQIVKTVNMYEENKIEQDAGNYLEPINIEPEINDSESYKTDNFEPDENIDGESEHDKDNSLGVLYTSSEIPEIENSAVMPEEEDFKPKNNLGKLVPVFTILAAIIIAGSLVGLFMKNRNSIDAETVIQSSPENELVSPEADNSGVLINGIEPAIPTDATDMSPSAPASTTKTAEKPKTAVQKPAATSAVNSPRKPLNANKTITLKKVSWEVPDYLSYSDNIRKYLQAACKSIRLTLSSDLLLTNDYIYANQVKVSIKLKKDGKVESAQIVKSSGSSQVDNVVLQTVKETLNVVKPPRGEVPTPYYKLGLIISL